MKKRTLSPLSSLEWHDLPIDLLSIGEEGIQFRILPYNENSGLYEPLLFSLTEADSFILDIRGKLTSLSLDSLEIHSLEFEEVRPGRISGKIQILPGSDGYWEIRFNDALWNLQTIDLFSDPTDFSL